MTVTKTNQSKTNRSRHFFWGISILLLGWCGLSAVAQSNPIRRLPQGWSDADRIKFYNTSQGSQLMPLSWFLALERADSQEPFAGDKLARFGYLPDSETMTGPLPVGFTVDKNSGEWVGMTCAACHTNRVDFKGTTMQIDGGPTDADLHVFLAELVKALQATLDDKAKFDRFADKVAGTNAKARTDLHNQLIRFSAYFSTFVAATSPLESAPWGPARADAFGAIFNRVSAVDLSDLVVWQYFNPLEQNTRTPDAPVSYPYLWGTSRLSWVQWDGIAPNNTGNPLKDPIFRLERNVVEVIGVFARINLNRPGILGYPSTVNTANQLILEEGLIRKLRSPQWPEDILGKIDRPMAAKGQVLYKQYCQNCHTVVDRNGTSRVQVNLTPLAEIGTDPTMATMVACRTADTGALAGTQQPPFLGPVLKSTDYVASLAANAGLGAITGSVVPKGTRKTAAAGKTQTTNLRPWIRSNLNAPGECVENLKQYIGRPLGGIWATAPYLHNGSVPNLYELLLPGEQRSAKFRVGSREFDPANVGFIDSEGPFEFDTTIPGNSNKGHEYGTNQLTEEQRRQLVEYMKTL